MATEQPARAGEIALLQRSIDRNDDHIRGGTLPSGVVSVVVYSDYLCPYCRRLRLVLTKLRQVVGERLAYVFRHAPNERAHPGAHFMSRAAEAAGAQGRFWEMHDLLYEHDLPLHENDVFECAEKLHLDMARFRHDLESDRIRKRVDDDIAEAKRNGITGTPTVFVDGIRYDGAWDFYSMLEALEQPVAHKLQRSARVFASLPAAGGLVLLLSAALALLAANTPLAPYYALFIHSQFGVGPPDRMVALTVGEWFSEGLLAIFFLLVGLEIRREMTAGALSDPKAAALPAIAAVGGVLAPTAIYLALNPGPTAPGWSVPTATDIAFVLGILALFGTRIPTSLRVFIAALAVVDDILSVLTLAIFYPREFRLDWLIASVALTIILYGLNRARVYAVWPYAVVAIALGFMLHAAGVHAALAGVVLAGFLPTRPAPAIAPLLGQAATALSALEQAEKDAKLSGEDRNIEEEPIWDWAGRNLSAATDRLISPAARIERAVSPWSAYVILPLFAFSATGVSFQVDLGSPEAGAILTGVILGLVIGKPLGICIATYLATVTRVGMAPSDVPLRQFIGAACLCGVGDTVALLMADQAFPGSMDSAVAKIGVLLGSVLAACLGAIVLATVSRAALITPLIKYEA